MFMVKLSITKAGDCMNPYTTCLTLLPYFKTFDQHTTANTGIKNVLRLMQRTELHSCSSPAT